MRYLFIYITLSTLCLNALSSQNDSIEKLREGQYIKELDSFSKLWLDELYKPNVEITGDSIKYNKEAVRTLSDTAYYKAIYPKKYNWVTTTHLLKNRAIKQAVWFMINLYHSDNKLNSKNVLETVYTMDHAIDMEKVLINSYYSYISFDPEVVILENKKVKEIFRPDIAEQKLVATRSIVQYLREFRKNNIKN